MLFADRGDAGRQLAHRLLHLQGTDAVVLALPRGGVPVAAEVARELRAPLDVIVVRKLGVPFQPEYGFGAIVVLDLSRRAQAQLKCENRLAVVPGATHLFPEPGALSQVTDLAAGWFGRHFARAGAIAHAA